MPHEVQIEGVGLVEFPDEMTEQDIAATIQNQILPSEQPSLQPVVEPMVVPEGPRSYRELKAQEFQPPAVPVWEPELIKEVARESWSTPAYQLPDIPSSVFETAFQNPMLNIPESAILGGLAGAGYDLARGLIEFPSTWKGRTQLALGPFGLPWMGYEMVRDLPETWRTAGEASVVGTPSEAIRGIAGGLGQTVLGPLLIGKGVKSISTLGKGLKMTDAQKALESDKQEFNEIWARSKSHAAGGVEKLVEYQESKQGKADWIQAETIKNRWNGDNPNTISPETAEMYWNRPDLYDKGSIQYAKRKQSQMLQGPITKEEYWQQRKGGVQNAEEMQRQTPLIEQPIVAAPAPVAPKPIVKPTDVVMSDLEAKIRRLWEERQVQKGQPAAQPSAPSAAIEGKAEQGTIPPVLAETVGTPTGPGIMGGPGAAAVQEFIPGKAEPVPIPHVSRAQRIRDTLSRLFEKRKGQGPDVPFEMDVNTALPDFLPHETSKAILSQPFGAERIPFFGRFLGGLRRIPGEVPETVVTYWGERGIGRANKSLLQLEYSWLDKPWKIKDGQIINIGRTKEGQSLFTGDVMEALRKDPNAYDLSVAQRNAFDAIVALEKDFKRLEKKHNIGNVMDDEGLLSEVIGAPEQVVETYFPRVVIERPYGEARGLTRGEGVGAKQFFEKPRMFDTEAEGWAKGYKYDTSISNRIATRAERLYKKIADQRLINDPALGGMTRKAKEAQWRQYYAEDLASGKITEERFQKMLDSAEAAGRVYQPGFTGKIYEPEVANALNQAFPKAISTYLKAAGDTNAALKTMWLAYDWGVGQLQGLVSANMNPKIWVEAQLKGIKAFFRPGFMAEFIRIPENLQAARELAQNGRPIGRFEEQLAGAERGQLIHRIPIIRSTLGKAAEPFARQFQTFLDVATIRLWQAYREVTPKEQWPRVIQTIESILGSSRMESVGVARNRMLLERVMFIAPAYYRGAINLVAAMGERGVSGQMARRAMTSYMAGMTVTFYAIAKALGMSDEEITQRMNPMRSDHMMWRVKIGKRTLNIGLGAIHKSLMRLAGNMVKTSIENPGNWASLTSEKNPVVRWYRGHAGPAIGMIWDQFTGKDFLGREVTIGKLRETPAPMVARSFLDPDQPVRAADLAATFLGLQSWEVPNEAQIEIGRQAKKFLSQQKRPIPSYTFDPNQSSYALLRHHLRLDNTKRASKVLDDLRKIRTDDQIIEAMDEYVDRPFTGSSDMEEAFISTLSESQRKTYQDAVRQKGENLRTFYEFLKKHPRTQ